MFTEELELSSIAGEDLKLYKHFVQFDSLRNSLTVFSQGKQTLNPMTQQFNS